MSEDAGLGEPLLLTYQQAMTKLGVSKSELYKLMKEGALTPISLGPQIRRLSMAEIRAYVRRIETEHGIGSAA